MTTQETIARAAQIIAGLQWPTPHSSAHIAQALADAGLLVSDAKDVMYLNHKLTEARDTIRRLNRRAQLAEAALHKQLKHPNGAQDPTVEALGERVRELEAERNMALGKVDEYRQRIAQVRDDLRDLGGGVKAEHAGESALSDALATIQRVRSALRCMERFRDELPPRSGYGEGSRQAYINCAKWLRTALDQEATE